MWQQRKSNTTRKNILSSKPKGSYLSSFLVRKHDGSDKEGCGDGVNAE